MGYGEVVFFVRVMVFGLYGVPRNFVSEKECIAHAGSMQPGILTGILVLKQL